MKILGYYVHKDDELTPSTAMVVIDEGESDKYTVYSPVGQHSTMQKDWFQECNPIGKESYIAISKGIYTPDDYLVSIRCNNCYTSFKSDEELELQKDLGEYYKGCPSCKTDSFLMDL